jgi:hypothetical protein
VLLNRRSVKVCHRFFSACWSCSLRQVSSSASMNQPAATSSKASLGPATGRGGRRESRVRLTRLIYGAAAFNAVSGECRLFLFACRMWIARWSRTQTRSRKVATARHCRRGPACAYPVIRDGWPAGARKGTWPRNRTGWPISKSALNLRKKE